MLKRDANAILKDARAVVKRLKKLRALGRKVKAKGLESSLADPPLRPAICAVLESGIAAAEDLIKELREELVESGCAV